MIIINNNIVVYIGLPCLHNLRPEAPEPLSKESLLFRQPKSKVIKPKTSLNTKVKMIHPYTPQNQVNHGKPA